MRTSILKTLSAVSIVLLMTGLCACGKKTPDVEENAYTYQATFTTYRQVTSKTYMHASEVNGDILTYIDGDSYVEPYHYALKVRNLETGEELSSVNLNVSEKDDIYFTAIHVCEDNSVVVAADMYNYETGEETIRCYTIDDSGNMKLCYELKNPGNEYGGYVSDIRFVGKDVVFISDTWLVRLDETGNKVFAISFDDWVSEYTIDKEGNIYAVVYGQNTKNSVYKIAKGETKEKLINKFSGITNIIVSDDGSLYGYSEDSFGKLNVEEGKVDVLFDWINIDISETFFFADRSVTSDEAMSFLTEKGNESGTLFERCNIKRVEKSKADSKIELIYGCQYADYEIKDEIVKFNKQNDKYRIVVKEYLGQAVDDYEKAYERFQMDIASGTVFDIVQTSNDEAREFGRKGYYADLNELIDKDTDYNRADYFENIIKLFETDGKLYSMPLSVYLETLIMPKSLADTVDKWDMDTFIALRNSYPDIPFAESFTKEYMILNLLTYCYGDFVDSETGDCFFNGEEFIKCLEFANTFPETIDYENYDSWNEIMKGNIKVSSMYIMDFNELSLYRQLYGEELSYIGYPSKNGGKNFVSSTANMAISAKSDNKEGAWEFIKQLLGYDYQYNTYNGFPILLSAFNDKIEAEKAKPNDEVYGTYGNRSVTIELYAATDVDIDSVANIVKNANALMEVDDKIYSIVYEEVQAYFKGSKTASEVADIIQSRVKIYLAETR